MNGRLVRREQLTDAERAAMFGLMEEYFLGVTEAQFDRDLAEKNWVILLEGAGRVRGFSTLLVREGVVHSGDTIVHRDAWGSSALARTWLEAIRELRPRYWLLITSGFRTYRFLPVFWKEFWPRHDEEERPALLETLARERFGSRYAEGIVRFEFPQVLRNGLKEVPTGRLTNPHVDFFVRANPGHARGDELVCLCPLTAENQTAAGRRLVAL
jgi:hypothetical protein